MDERSLRSVVMEVIGRENILDDCAIIPLGERFMVASTDMLHESADFPEGISDWQIGWMSVAVTMSDIAAMGAVPSDILLAVGLDRASRLRAILEGARACCDMYDTRLSGGDLDFHRELTLVSSGIGFTDRPVKRAGSRPGEVIAITGIPGRAQAALEGYSRYAEYLLQPSPQVREGRTLAASGVTSMMDVSDGLIISLYDMLDANQCGYEVFSEMMPLLEGVAEKERIPYALYGGGDYELLFTCPPDILPVMGVDIHVIGKVIPEHEVRVDGAPAEMKGYQHYWD